MLNIITANDVPRLEGGGLAICHFCQRDTSFNGSFTLLLADDLFYMARQVAARPHRTARKVKRPNIWYRQERLLRRMERMKRSQKVE